MTTDLLWESYAHTLLDEWYDIYEARLLVGSFISEREAALQALCLMQCFEELHNRNLLEFAGQMNADAPCDEIITEVEFVMLYHAAREEYEVAGSGEAIQCSTIVLPSAVIR